MPVVRYLWVFVGLFFLALGIVGAFVPLLPSVVFWLIAAYAFSRSSDRLHNWMLAHSVIGPSIRDWRERGAISIKGKRAATVAVAFTIVVSFGIGLSALVLGIQSIVLIAVLTFIWSRPSY